MTDDKPEDNAAYENAPPKRGRGAPTKLTPDLQQQVCAFIRAGMWDYRAAESAGIGRTTFYRWLDRGSKSAHGIYHNFWVEVVKACSQAAGFAETRVYAERPFDWLRCGPGRSQPGAPGWTESSELTVHAGPIEVSIVYTDATGSAVAASGRAAHAADRTPAAATASVAGNGDRRHT